MSTPFVHVLCPFGYESVGVFLSALEGCLSKYPTVEYYAPNKMTLKGILII